MSRGLLVTAGHFPRTNARTIVALPAELALTGP